jgi:tricorn protease
MGRRTAGAGIGGSAFIPELIDGGRVSIPNRAAYDPAGSWGIENQGIRPDVEVELLPRNWLEGMDPLLERAINTVLTRAADDPPPEPDVPEPPKYGNDGDRTGSR